MSARAGISTYRRFPKELFRVNIGWRVHLLPRLTSTPDGFFDIATEHEPGTSVRDGKVLPRVFDPDYERTYIPDNLILVREAPDLEDWSLQPAVEMTFREFNESITNFFLDKGSLMRCEQWLNAYPRSDGPRKAHYPLPRNWRVAKSDPGSM
ncbi:hypothetical protein ACRE_070550 [Hapsidospora chrysogenum ATCC 11550]|uniref:Tse2 ADP-ribosyltransferase toxin domain-containing protein n=1 Tax=Hapsidospora chrysogenum (strain ATCC 11550 / CBS 779.69 / DSM 880 / IAM 14645 / JCM 23072 / IMI 49137) TaxID=857340 RepID=A0A086SYL7_HAPC1|nr:hypothetical protein ACRE_070550 [Hapsidospora chrysogenum ATCC 11550]